MQIVIDIPEEMYKWVNDANKFFDDYGTSDFIDLVKSGTPLPKGHGDLVDKNDLSLMTVHLIDGVFVCTAHTIIEADIGGE